MHVGWQEAESTQRVFVGAQEHKIQADTQKLGEHRDRLRAVQIVH